MHGAHGLVAGRLAVQQVQEMAADRIVVGFHLDAPSVLAVVKPVEQHGAERGDQAVGDVARAGQVVVVFLGECSAEHGAPRAHHVHRMRGGGDALQRGFDGLRQTAQRFQLELVVGELARIGQCAVDQQVSDLLEFALLGDIENVVAAVVEVIAAAADGAQRGIAGGDAGQGNGFFGFETAGRVIAAHCLLLARYGQVRAPMRISLRGCGRRKKGGTAAGDRLLFVMRCAY